VFTSGSHRQNGPVRVSAKVDYAVRAMAELAAAGGGPVKADQLSQAQSIPVKFLENIMIDLRHAGLVRSQRGSEGGYWLARPAEEISIADVIRGVEGPLADIRGQAAEKLAYEGAASPLREVWVAVRASLRSVLETVTLADIASGNLPPVVEELTRAEGAWLRR
jgi:Rrf2 family protein